MSLIPESSSHQNSELVAYHKIKRKFINPMDMAVEDPDQLVMCELRGHDFELVA